ncbi:MAG: precorrin-3B C(17)-methyltransferase [Dehalococcoidia bacterium]|nr:precorrin-3B C(17)-methyltransferase [Dehalococcoidia bacterium]
MASRVFIVGIGPGPSDLITARAKKAIRSVSVIIGQPDCLAQIVHLTQGKEVMAISKNPLVRTQTALEKTKNGQNVAIVASGDPGTYAISATFLDYLHTNNIQIEVEVIPAIGLSSYASALLGAALGGDSASISLSDQGTPWEIIINRFETAVNADFVVVIYNPFGKLGSNRWQKALSILKLKRAPATPIGILTQANTPLERLFLTTLGELEVTDFPSDTLFIIGNSQSYISFGRMVTPRRYQEGIGY